MRRGAARIVCLCDHVAASSGAAGNICIECRAKRNALMGAESVTYLV